MPRSLNRVNRKPTRASARTSTAFASRLPKIGFVDIHCHGGFGIDLMRASGPELDTLAEKLGHAGVRAFCPTTLTCDFDDLLQTVDRLGAWVKTAQAHRRRSSLAHSTARTPARSLARPAVPIGLHLEGPFLSPKASGAHPPKALRRFSRSAMMALWKASHQTLKIMTLAPESLSGADLTWVTAFARRNRIVLSLGHSAATEAEAHRAFQAGFTNVTHAWNAMPFQHRSPGVLGAALGGKSLGKTDPPFLELICDGIHVSPTVMDWTLLLHPRDRICLISDCAPCAGCRAEVTTSFGPLTVFNQDGAARILTSPPAARPAPLAGAGELLPTLFFRWAEDRARRLGRPLLEVIREAAPWVSSVPLDSLRLSPAQRRFFDRA